MSKDKKNIADNPAILIGGIVTALRILVIGAYFKGQRQAVEHAEAKHGQVKKLRARKEPNEKMHRY